ETFAIPTQAAPSPATSIARRVEIRPNMGRAVLGVLAILSTAAVLSACRDVSRFTTAGDHYEGPVVAADFVRVGVDSNVNACLPIDANRLQDLGGWLSPSAGGFHEV